MPGWFGALFSEMNCPSVPVRVRGGGGGGGGGVVQKLFGQCPNAQVNNLRGASLKSQYPGPVVPLAMFL